MKRILVAVALITGIVFSQTMTVRVKGEGKTKNEAIENAKRFAVEQAGVAVISETRVENFQLIQDIIKSRAEGYIQSYNIISETTSMDKFIVEIEAIISKNPVDADVKSLTERMGGIRFMVYYEPDAISIDKRLLEYTMNRINELLTNNKYRCAEPNVVRKLIEQARQLSEQSAFTKAQEIAYAADASYYIEIANLSITTRQLGEKLRITSPPEVSLELKLYDTGTAEVITNVVSRISGDSASWNEDNAILNAIDKAVQEIGTKFLYRIPEQFGNWLNTGYPYQLRFFGITNPDLVDQLIIKLQEDPKVGGEMMPNDVAGYTWVNITYKGTPFQLNLAVRKIMMGIPGLTNVQRKLMVFNQINFAPANIEIPQPRLAQLPIER